MMFLPAVVAWNAEMRLANACVGVEYATMLSCAAGSDFSFAALGVDAAATPIAPTPKPATIAPTNTDRAVRPNFIAASRPCPNCQTARVLAAFLH